MLKDKIEKLFEEIDYRDNPDLAGRADIHIEDNVPSDSTIWHIIQKNKPISLNSVVEILVKGGYHAVRATEAVRNAMKNNREKFVDMSLKGDIIVGQTTSQWDNLKNPTKKEGTGPADGNSGESQSMVGSMTYESKLSENYIRVFSKLKNKWIVKDVRRMSDEELRKWALKFDALDAASREATDINREIGRRGQGTPKRKQ